MATVTVTVQEKIIRYKREMIVSVCVPVEVEDNDYDAAVNKAAKYAFIGCKDAIDKMQVK